MTPILQLPKNVLLLMILTSISFSPATHAINFSIGETDLTFTSDITIGGAWRMEEPSKALYTSGNREGGTASAGVTDDGNLNFDKGDLFSLIVKGRHDLEISRGNVGGFIRFREWYDYELEKGDRSHGSVLNYYEKDEPLSDSEFNDFAQSSGAEVLDAYLFGSVDLGDIPVEVRLGRQVVSWGESTFIQNGANIINPADVTALRKPGSSLKDALLPIGMLYVSTGLTTDLSMELFYQYEWKPIIIDGCGNYFANNDVLSEGCDKLTALSTVSDRSLLTEVQALEANIGGVAVSVPVEEGYVDRDFAMEDRLEPEDGNQYGIAFRYFSEQLQSTEFGFYYVKYHSRFPIFSGVKASGDPGPIPGIGLNLQAPLLNVDTKPGYFAEYPEDIEVYALSFAKNIGTWAVSGEISYRDNMPVQLNTTEILHALGLGPIAAPWSKLNDRAAALDYGEPLHGYDDFEFTQIQFTFINFFEQVLGASIIQFVAEIGANFIGGLPDESKFRYGRSPNYGVGEFAPIQAEALIPGTEIGAGTISCEKGILITPNEVAKNCTLGDGGYITDSAWGYRFLVRFEYPNAFWGVNLFPSLSFSHDVDGHSPPPNFIEGRMATNFGLDAEYLNRYTAGLSYTVFDGADFDDLEDRDFMTLSFGISF